MMRAFWWGLSHGKPEAIVFVFALVALVVCLAPACNDEDFVSGDPARAAAIASKYEGENIVIPRGGVISFGRNPRRYQQDYQWRVEQVTGEDGGQAVFARCSGRFTVVSVEGENYELECIDTEEARR